MNYLSWQEKTITDFSDNVISNMYNQGFVFTRIGRGVMQQTRAVRINLAEFELSSENRRILRKIDKDPVTFTGVTLKKIELPVATADYHWSTAKMAKDFYEKKFGAGVMSAAKIKEMLTDSTKSNFNTLLSFSQKNSDTVGFAICYTNTTLLHYSYPFYDLGKAPKDMGLGMMTLAIVYAKAAGLSHIYLGSLQRPSDTYKLQFSGIEWFDGGTDGAGVWQKDIEKAKTILK